MADAKLGGEPVSTVRIFADPSERPPDLDPALRSSLEGIVAKAVSEVVVRNRARIVAARDAEWVAQQLLLGRADLRRGIEEYDQTIDPPAHRGAVDSEWVEAVLAKRDQYLREKIAPLLGLDPDLVVRASRTSAGLARLVAAHGAGSLA